MTIQTAIVACRKRQESLVRPREWRGSGTALKIQPGMETFLKLTPLNQVAYTGQGWIPSIDDLLSRWEMVTMETLLKEVKQDDSGERKNDSGERYQDVL